MYIDAAGRKWYKGNLHLHTTESDGKKTPAEAYAVYRSMGYDFIARTDHWKPAMDDMFEGMPVLAGGEFNLDRPAIEGVYHIVGLGYDHIPEITREFTDPQRIIDAIHAAGGLADLAHPAWSLNTPEMLMALKDVDMSEIFNSISDYPLNCRPDSSLILDMMAVQGRCWKLIAADDVHFFTAAETCRSFIWLQAEDLSKKALMEALRAGRYYPSQGPTLETRVLEDGSLEVNCSPVERITYFTDKPWDKNRCTVGKNLTHDVFTPGKNTHFIRVELTDGLGRRAWSQYICL